MVYKVMLSKRILKGIKILKRNGIPISFKHLDEKEGVERINASCFVDEGNVIVRGGSATSGFFTGKKVKIFAIDGTSKELLGGDNLFISNFICILYDSLLNFSNFQDQESHQMKIMSYQFCRLNSKTVPSS